MSESIEQRVFRVVADTAGEPIDEINTHTRFREDLGCDSLDDLDIIFALQEEFDVTIEERDFGGLVTVGHVVERMLILTGRVP